jgi:hypothetical protein
MAAKGRHGESAVVSYARRILFIYLKNQSYEPICRNKFESTKRSSSEISGRRYCRAAYFPHNTHGRVESDGERDSDNVPTYGQDVICGLATRCAISSVAIRPPHQNPVLGVRAAVSPDPVPPFQWLNLSGLLKGTTQPPGLKDAAMGYDEARSGHSGCITTIRI